MGEDKISELEVQLAKAKEEAYAREKARSETQAMLEVTQDTNKTLRMKLNQKVADHIETDEKVAIRVEETANKLVDKGLEVQSNEAIASVMSSQDAIMEADFKKNAKEYKYHGIDHKIDKQWKRTLIMVENDIWFVIWAIIGLFTFVPVSIFLDRIRVLSGFVRWVAIFFGVILGLACLAGFTYWVLNITGVTN